MFQGWFITKFGDTTMTYFRFSLFFILILFFMFAISWFVFSRVSVKRIDKEMAADGVSKACPVDIMGLRIIRIAGAISMSYNSILNPEVDFFMDIRPIQPYAKKHDRILAFVVFTSGHLCIVMGLIHSYLYSK